MQLTKNKAQIVPHQMTEEHMREETQIDKEYKIRSLGQNSDKKERNSTLVTKGAWNNRIGELNQEKTINELTDLKTYEPNENNSLFIRADITSKRWQIVANFIEKIKIYSLSQRFRKTKKSQLDIINDQTFNYEYFYNKNYFQQEDSKASRFWDTIQFITLVIYIIYLPIRLAFDALHSYFTPFEALPNIIQIINMFLEFNTGFYKQGLVITDRKQIFWHYATKKFMQQNFLKQDLILEYRFPYQFNFMHIKYLHLQLDMIQFQIFAGQYLQIAMGLFRIIVVAYLINEIEETFKLREIFGSYLDLYQLGGFIFISAHFSGCCWYALAAYEKSLGINNTWYDRDIHNYEIELVVDEVIYGYIASFYWSIVTMCTVGYGDIGPTTYRERIFVIVMVLLSSFIFGFSMNAIGDIIRNLRENSEMFKQQMSVLNLYMKKRSLNQQLQSKVRRYYEYLYIERKENNQQGAELIENLAPFLRDEVQKDIYLNMFEKKKLFSLNFSPKLISKLYKIVKEKKYGVDEYLFKEGDVSEKIFLILQGEVQIILQDRVILQTLTDGDFVGQIEFFSNKMYQFSSKTTKFTQIAIIERKDFMQLLTLRQSDLESFSQMKDNILSYQNTSQIEHRCESCGKYGHMFDSCRLIKLFSNKHRQIYEFNSLKQITRQPWNRKTIQYPSIKKANDTQKSIQNFISFFNAKLMYYQQQLSNNYLNVKLQQRYFYL